ncbi:MAG: hypothetical protein F6J87_10900 [Spirulina sp. SIO3F2]|nr:hypothetical protein [Spirulina sp. SIO3F2]
MVSQQAERPELIKKILHQVRQPEKILVKSAQYNQVSRSLTSQILCPQNTLFPNNQLTEVTGSQILDTVSQVGYIFIGNLIIQDLSFGFLQFEDYLLKLNSHKVNLVDLQISFLRPILHQHTFQVEFKLSKNPVQKKSHCLIPFEFVAFQENSRHVRKKVFTGSLVACYRF